MIRRRAIHYKDGLPQFIECTNNAEIKREGTVTAGIEEKMNSKQLRRLEAILVEATAKRTWGEIQIDLKDGKPILMRTTIQAKIFDEDRPDASKRQPGT